MKECPGGAFCMNWLSKCETCIWHPYKKGGIEDNLDFTSYCGKLYQMSPFMDTKTLSQKKRNQI